MKFLMIATLFALFSSCEEKSTDSKPAIKTESASSVLPEEIQDPEDCDDKVEKLEKEPPVEINLGENPDAGCSIK